MNEISSKSAPRDIEHAAPLPGKRIKAGTDEAEIICAFDGAQTSGDFLLDLGHADSAFAQTEAIAAA